MVATDIPHIHHFLLACLAICSIGTAIRATTTGLIPLNILTTTGLSWNPVNAIAIISIIRNGGATLPRVATMLPFVPFSLYPTKIEMFTARRPGADWDKATMSGK